MSHSTLQLVGASLLAATATYLLTRSKRNRLDAKKGSPKEKVTKNVVAPSLPEDVLPCTPVGVVESCFPRLTGTPRQSRLVPSGKARIRVKKVFAANGALEGLEHYSHAWIVWVFHKNVSGKKAEGRTASQSFRTKIRAPKLAPHAESAGSSVPRTGVFGTRSPHRPNPIGLSVVKIDSVNVAEGILEISGIDMVHGTPVLDIKPYHPVLDRIENATAPSWVLAACDASPVVVTVSAEAEKQMKDLEPQLRMYADNAAGALRALTEALSLNVRDGATRAAKKKQGKDVNNVGSTFVVPFDTTVCSVRVEDEAGSLRVIEVRLDTN